MLFLSTLVLSLVLSNGIPSDAAPIAQDDNVVAPLRDWMRDVIDVAAQAKDATALANAFDTLADHGPQGYDDWSAIASRGAEAARGGDVKSARKACLGCHMKYQRPYRDAFRASAWP